MVTASSKQGKVISNGEEEKNSKCEKFMTWSDEQLSPTHLKLIYPIFLISVLICLTNTD